MPNSKDFLYDINSPISWDDQVYEALKLFYAAYQQQATILMANSLTLEQFDIFINLLPDQEKPYVAMQETKNEVPQTSEEDGGRTIWFSSLIRRLDFAVDDDMQDRAFRLIYDEEVEWE